MSMIGSAGEGQVSTFPTVVHLPPRSVKFKFNSDANFGKRARFCRLMQNETTFRQTVVPLLLRGKTVGGSPLDVLRRDCAQHHNTSPARIYTPAHCEQEGNTVLLL